MMNMKIHACVYTSAVLYGIGLASGAVLGAHGALHTDLGDPVDVYVDYDGRHHRRMYFSHS